MQVEKRHYAINLLLLMLFYISFLPIDIPNFRQIISVTLNVILFRRILLKSSIKSIVVIGTVFEVISSGVIGCFILNYFVISKTIDYANEKLTAINNFALMIIASLAISISMSLELLIKTYLDFTINSSYYQVIAIASIISIIFIQYILKTSLKSESYIYRHLIQSSVE